MEEKFIDLSELGLGLPAVTPEFGGYLAQASAFCLSQKGHDSGVNLTVGGSFRDYFQILWDFTITEQIKRCFGDLQEATECGATGIALLLVRKLTEYNVIYRSIKGTGFDYWLGNENDSDSEFLPFQNKARLEISGILEGTEGIIKTRVKAKIKQTNVSDKLSIPAIIIVTEFSRPISQVKKK